MKKINYYYYSDSSLNYKYVNQLKWPNQLDNKGGDSFKREIIASWSRLLLLLLLQFLRHGQL